MICPNCKSQISFFNSDCPRCHKPIPNGKVFGIDCDKDLISSPFLIRVLMVFGIVLILVIGYSMIFPRSANQGYTINTLTIALTIQLIIQGQIKLKKMTNNNQNRSST